MLIICVYGGHRYWLLWMYWRRRDARKNPQPASTFEDLPRVTVQLPMFNEPAVAQRAIDAACRLDYPRDRLRIQVLDDSTDETVDLAAACCQEWRERGVDVCHIRRPDRAGFKAGALAAGLEYDDSEFVAVFDADFVPPPEFLRETIHHFTDAGVGVVQAEWSHLNRHESILTECQAMYLDGHFVIEQTARATNDRWFNFNGTAGVWRRTCIDDSGGWRHDTLTEDTDLSYRAQLRGWRFVYLPETRCAAELPGTTAAFLSQQHRWNKGMTQTAMKLLGPIFRSDASWPVKIEAFFHLTSPVVYVAIVGLLLVSGAAFLLGASVGGAPLAWSVVLATVLLGFGVVAAGSFYVAAHSVLGYRWWEAVVFMPALLAVGIGLSVVNTRAVLEALARRESPFVRTPKRSQGRTNADVDPAARSRSRVPPGTLETALGCLAAACFVLSFTMPVTLVSAPFLLLFATGYLGTGWARLAGSLRRN